jgi:dTMP kinase
MQGRFISLEGGEGVGKTTLINGIANALTDRGLHTVVTREPGGTPGAEILRDILLKGDTDRWSAMTEALMMYAGRVDHVDRLIKPALKRGAWVLCDRFADSTTAYQGSAGGVPLEQIKALHAAALADFKPDLTFVVDLDPKLGIQRTIERGESATRFERFDAAFHDRLRKAFLTIAVDNPKRCVVLDGSKSKDAILADALAVIDQRFGRSK